MERIYALGISIIEVVQDWLYDYENFFEFVNEVSNPNYMLQVLFPLVSVVDSVFATQLVLCMAFGGWLNAVMKWWLLEDRPYWWVRETDFYPENRRPVIRQFRQTCETGPGCPSGHSETAAMLVILIICWFSHFMNDRKWHVRWWKGVLYPASGAWLSAVMVARLYVGTHFPHQVLAGALLGGFLAPALCIYVTDPYVWQYGYHAGASVARTVSWHVASVAAMIGISVATYYSLILCGMDPQSTIKLAFRWCEHPDSIHVSTTPLFSLAHSTGHLLGWALCVTPAVAKYRHYTKSRSLIISAFATAIIMYAWRHLEAGVARDSAVKFYAVHFTLCAVRVPLLLRLVPALAAWPYIKHKKD